MEDIMTVEEAARALGIKEARVRQLCRSGVMGRKMGRDWIISRDDVEHYRKTRRPPGRPPKK
jgi:excisionase family DNA binding protein